MAERQMRSGIKWVKLHWVTVKGDSSEDEPWFDSISDQCVLLILPPQSVQLEWEAETASYKDFSLESTIRPTRGLVPMITSGQDRCSNELLCQQNIPGSHAFLKVLCHFLLCHWLLSPVTSSENCIAWLQKALNPALVAPIWLLLLEPNHWYQLHTCRRNWGCHASKWVLSASRIRREGIWMESKPILLDTT